MSRTTTLFDTISLDSKRTIYGMVRPIDLYVLCRVSYSMRISVLHIYPDYNLKYFMNISIKLEELCELPVYITGVLLLYALKGYRVNFMNDDNLEMITIVNLTGDTMFGELIMKDTQFTLDNSFVGSSLIPDGDGTRDLGSDSYRWRDIYQAENDENGLGSCVLG